MVMDGLSRFELWLDFRIGGDGIFGFGKKTAFFGGVRRCRRILLGVEFE